MRSATESNKSRRSSTLTSRKQTCSFLTSITKHPTTSCCRRSRQTVLGKAFVRGKSLPHAQIHVAILNATLLDSPSGPYRKTIQLTSNLVDVDSDVILDGASKGERQPSPCVAWGRLSVLFRTTGPSSSPCTMPNVVSFPRRV